MTVLSVTNRPKQACRMNYHLTKGAGINPAGWSMGEEINISIGEVQGNQYGAAGAYPDSVLFNVWWEA